MTFAMTSHHIYFTAVMSFTMNRTLLSLTTSEVEMMSGSQVCMTNDSMIVCGVSEEDCGSCSKLFLCID